MSLYTKILLSGIVALIVILVVIAILWSSTTVSFFKWPPSGSLEVTKNRAIVILSYTAIALLVGLLIVAGIDFYKRP